MDVSHWGKKRIVPLLVIFAVAAIFIGGFFALRSTGRLAMFASAEAMQAWVANFGAGAPAVFFAVQTLQVIVSPIPGNVTTLVGGMMFGFWPAFVLSTAAILTGSLIAFALARNLGRALVIRLVGPKITERYLGALSSRARIVLVLMLLLPFFPDDALSLVAGLTSLSWTFFLLASVCTRPWGLLFSSLVGAGVVQVPSWGWAVIAAGTVALAWVSIKWGPAIEQRLYHRITRGNSRSVTNRVPRTPDSRSGSHESHD
ncbi:TVP38/TMEM64 family protein [Candidatus Bipolaricaulota bacterium]